MTDKSAALYHVMKATEDFDTTARMLFDVIRYSQEKFPGKPRVLFLDVEGHRNAAKGFDPDASEILINFAMNVLMPYLSEIHTPLLVAHNPEQKDDVPPELIIKPAGSEMFPHLFPGQS